LMFVSPNLSIISTGALEGAEISYMCKKLASAKYTI
jgi:hypothetical protein